MAQQFAPTRVDRLPNGMQVLTRELHHAPVACVMVWYGVGSRNEEPGTTGLSHFLEHMMFKGTPRFPYGVLEEGVKRRGGMWNAFTSYDYTTYYEVLPARHLAYGLEVEADRMVNMTFDPDLTVRERGIIVSEREGRENSPHFWLFEAFMHEAFREFPYRHHVLGYKDDIKATTAEALTKHYRRFYRPDNATLVVAGDFGTDDLLKLAERHFGHLPAGDAIPALTAVEPEQTAERRVEVRRPGPNPQMMAGYKIPGADHPDHAALTVLSAVLSGGPSFAMMGGGASMGRSSRLFRRLINTGIASAASGQPWSLQYPGLFLVSATPVPGTANDKLEAALFAELETLRQDAVPAEELGRAKKQVRAQFVYGMESAINQAVMLGSTALTTGVEHFDNAMEEYEAVTADDVLRVAQTYLKPERRT
ncbi:MAG TPA: pitrilysin family protein, partial [Symbiobacteriaceae bacterium]|nr:pitrilysin family protein [Symbiobacteriaceae bacterium]